MTDRQLNIPDALREAQLQRLEAPGLQGSIKASGHNTASKNKNKDAKASD